MVLFNRRTLAVSLLLSSSAVTSRTVTAFTPSTTTTSKIQRAAAVLVEISAAQSPAFRKKGPIGTLIPSNSNHHHHKKATTTTVLDATVVESESITTNSSAVDVDSIRQHTSSSDIDSNDGDIQSTVLLPTLTTATTTTRKAGTIELADRDAKLLREMEVQASSLVDELMDETCEVDESTGTALDELCVDEEKRNGFRATLKGYVQSIESLIVGRKSTSSDDADAAEAVPAKRKQLTGDELEKGCEWYLYSRVPKRADDSIVVS